MGLKLRLVMAVHSPIILMEGSKLLIQNYFEKKNYVIWSSLYKNFGTAAVGLGQEIIDEIVADQFMDSQILPCIRNF